MLLARSTLLALTFGALLLTAVPTQASPAKDFISAKHKKLDEITAKSTTVDAMRDKIRKEMDGFVDYEEMSRLTLPTQWEGLDAAKRKEFTDLFKKMIQKTYVKRFEPQKSLHIEYQGEETLGDGRMKVKSIIKSGRSSADVHYLMRERGGRFWVHDIVIDDASQVQNYRRQFKKLVDKEGWSGLIARMKKNVAK